jgi:hypothetical protein
LPVQAVKRHFKAPERQFRPENDKSLKRQKVKRIIRFLDLKIHQYSKYIFKIKDPIYRSGGHGGSCNRILAARKDTTKSKEPTDD